MVHSSDTDSISGHAIPVREPGDDGEFIYHYTDTKGMMGIIEKRILWATDLRYMNDPGEATFSLEAIQRFLDEHKPESEDVRKVFASVQRLYKKASQQGVGLPGYIACLSRAPDLLSQWRAYGHGHGFSIGFDLKGLEELFSSLHRNIRIEEVVYDKDPQLKKLKQAAAEAETNPSILRSSAALLFASTFFKHEAFSEEEEVRIYAFQPGDPPKGIEFRESGLGLTPYITIPLCRDGEGMSVIRKIIIGPQPLAGEVEQTLSQFLKARGQPEVEVAQSEVPLRA